MKEWDGTFSKVIDLSNGKIIVLNLINIVGMQIEGRRNLIFIDSNDEVIWVAEAPLLGRESGWYQKVVFENNKLKGWYGGSVLVEINLDNGKVMEEEFIK